MHFLPCKLLLVGSNYGILFFLMRLMVDHYKSNNNFASWSSVFHIICFMWLFLRGLFWLLTVFPFNETNFYFMLSLYWLPNPLQFGSYMLLPLFFTQVLHPGQWERYWSYIPSTYIVALAMLFLFQLFWSLLACMERERCNDTGDTACFPAEYRNVALRIVTSVCFIALAIFQGSFASQIAAMDRHLYQRYFILSLTQLRVINAVLVVSFLSKGLYQVLAIFHLFPIPDIPLEGNRDISVMCLFIFEFWEYIPTLLLVLNVTSKSVGNANAGVTKTGASLILKNMRDIFSFEALFRISKPRTISINRRANSYGSLQCYEDAAEREQEDDVSPLYGFGPRVSKRPYHGGGVIASPLNPRSAEEIMLAGGIFYEHHRAVGSPLLNNKPRLSELEEEIAETGGLRSPPPYLLALHNHRSLAAGDSPVRTRGILFSKGVIIPKESETESQTIRNLRRFCAPSSLRPSSSWLSTSSSVEVDATFLSNYSSTFGSRDASGASGAGSGGHYPATVAIERSRRQRERAESYSLPRIDSVSIDSHSPLPSAASARLVRMPTEPDERRAYFPHSELTVEAVSRIPAFQASSPLPPPTAALTASIAAVETKLDGAQSRFEPHPSSATTPQASVTRAATGASDSSYPEVVVIQPRFSRNGYVSLVLAPPSPPSGSEDSNNLSPAYAATARASPKGRGQQSSNIGTITGASASPRAVSVSRTSNSSNTSYAAVLAFNAAGTTNNTTASKKISSTTRSSVFASDTPRAHPVSAPLPSRLSPSQAALNQQIQMDYDNKVLHMQQLQRNNEMEQLRKQRILDFFYRQEQEYRQHLLQMQRVQHMQKQHEYYLYQRQQYQRQQLVQRQNPERPASDEARPTQPAFDSDRVRMQMLSRNFSFPIGPVVLSARQKDGQQFQQEQVPQPQQSHQQPQCNISGTQVHLDSTAQDTSAVMRQSSSLSQSKEGTPPGIVTPVPHPSTVPYPAITTPLTTAPPMSTPSRVVMAAPRPTRYGTSRSLATQLLSRELAAHVPKVSTPDSRDAFTPDSDTSSSPMSQLEMGRIAQAKSAAAAARFKANNPSPAAFSPK